MGSFCEEQISVWQLLRVPGRENEMRKLEYSGRDATRKSGDTLCKIGAHTLVPLRSPKDIYQRPGRGVGVAWAAVGSVLAEE